jgi:hypothetical protein
MMRLHPPSVKLYVLVIAMILVNLTFILNYDFAASQSELSNDDLRPELNDFWEYRRFDYLDDSIWYYNLTMTGETTIKVANKDIKALVLEGNGIIEQWPKDLEVADDAKIYIKKLVDRETLEVIKYTQYLDLVYIIEGRSTTRFTHENYTYNYVEYTKPLNYTIGSNWSKSVINTRDLNFKDETGEIKQSPPHTDQTNSTYLVDSVKYVMTGSKGYNTLLILERQWNKDIIDTTIEYYYSDQVNGYVQKIRRDFTGEIEEMEKLISYKKLEPDDIKEPNGTDDNESDNWFDLGNTNTQILISAICIVVALVIIGFVGYRKRR